ncbi:MAG: NADH-quinone oxidoreductase subunit C [Thaumarchaeota archaeon]|nr:NADH-quinone oxidoreductase subunit C [Nitrososphaerota archaeon]
MSKPTPGTQQPAKPAAPTAAAPPSPPSQPKPEPARAKKLASTITAQFPDAKVDYLREKRLKVTVSSATIKAVATMVRDDLGFDHPSAVSGVDWIAKNEIEIIYFIGSLTREGLRDFVLAIAERVPRASPVAPSLIDVWTGVEYHERESQEMLGIDFKGNPFKGHFLLPEDWNDMPPLRKDYVSPGR